jgi:transposase
MKSNKSNRFPPKCESMPFGWCRSIEASIPPLWACIESIAPKIGRVAQILRESVKQHVIDTGVRDGLNTDERVRIKALESSVGSVGDIYDNALAETINGLYKAEAIHKQRSW